MNKKLMAVAVAGVFAAPAAFAQSSVTISGQIKGGFESLKLSNQFVGVAPSTTAGGGSTFLGRGNTSQTGVVDDSSALVFSVVEDLGGGLSAVVRLDMRIKPDDAGGVNSPGGITQGAYNTGNIVSGNSHFGLLHKEWGRIVFGRQDLHYFNTESNITDKGSLRASTTSLLSYIGSTAIANATRTTNVVHYLSPNWSGFTFILAYSANPFNSSAQETDIGGAGASAGGTAAVGVNTNRKGSGWNFNPNFAAANWQVGYSYWGAKPDTPTPAIAQITNSGTGAAASGILAAGLAGSVTGTLKQRGDRLYGSYVFPFGLKIGAAWDKTKFTSNTPGATNGIELNKRTAWSIPVSYAWGNHTIHVNYTKANDDTGTGVGIVSPTGGLAIPAGTTTTSGDQGATMWAFAYSYDLSKRTSLALTYAQIKNKNPDSNNVGGGTYNLFTSTSLGLGGSAGGLTPGEDPKMFGLTLRHAF